MAQNNQNLQNAANQRSQELKPTRQTTGAGETSKPTGASEDRTQVDGSVSSENRDVETFATENAAERATGGNDTEAKH